MKELTNLTQRLAKIEALITQSILSQKKVLTLEEAATYTGRTLSNLYKLTASRTIPHYKPEGKMISFHREELEAWMLRNPVRTKESIDSEAATYVFLNKKEGWA